MDGGEQAADVAPDTSLAERVYQRIRTDLLRGEIAPGSRVTEEWAAAHYAASRTPVREACRRLAQEGLLIHAPRRGYHAPPISAREIEELYEVRRALEVVAVRRAAAHRGDHEERLVSLHATWAGKPFKPGEQIVYNDEAFHRTVADVGGNAQLVALLDSIAARIRFVRVHDFLDRDRISATHAQHLGILDAISCGDGDLAAALMHAHISESQRAVAAAAEVAARRGVRVVSS